MTLKEKLKKLNLSTWISSRDTEKIEKTADEFAIGFAEWITRAELPLKELLEIYKKGL